MNDKPRIAVYPGSFDPLHNGHREIIRRARPAFDELVVAVLHNEEKRVLFDAEERVVMIREVLDRDGLTDVKVTSFSGLLVDFMGQIGGCAVVRGLRAVSDFEYEFQMALMNRRLDPRFETFFLATSEQYSFLSSRLVKEVYSLGGDLTGLVPRPILARLEARLRPSATE